MKLYFAILLMASASVHAQVYKCPDPANNRITYSDAPCTGGRQLERQRSQAEIMAERQHAAREAQRTQAQDQRMESIESRYSQPSGPSGQAPSACPSDLEIRNLETSASSVTASKEQRKIAGQAALAARACKYGGNVVTQEEPAPSTRRERVPTGGIPQPAQLTSCDPSGCWDTTGSRYTRTNGGNFVRSDGKFCIGSGAQLTCN